MNILKKTNLKIFSGLVTGIIVLLSLFGLFNLFTFSTDEIGDKEYQKMIDSTYTIYALPTPNEITFAGEKIPIENFDVKEAIDLELHKISYWQSEMFLYLKRANRYFPVIEKILKENGLHDDFKYLAVAESGLTNVTSPAGAKGYWQFMKSAAKKYKLEVNKYVDERYNLEKSTEAACEYLKNSYSKYKNWAMAAASYNLGQGNLDKQIKKQKVNNYYDLLLNEETGRYMYRIIALKIIMSNPERYGFRFRKKDLYPVLKTKEVKVDSSVTDFVAFANKYKMNYKTLKLLNPWLRDNFLKNKSKKTYIIKVLKENARTKTYFTEKQQENNQTDTIK